MLVIAWHLLAHDVNYADLGPDHFDQRIDAKRRERYLIRELEKLGPKVTLEPAA